MKLSLFAIVLASAGAVDPAPPPICDNSKPFAGKVFLVTGASSGIGAAIAKQLAIDGATVALAARRVEKLEDLKNEIDQLGGSSSVVKMDVLDYASVEHAVNATVEQHGKLDGAFNNAGGTGTPMRVGDADLTEWKRVFELNLYGTLNCMRAELDVMKKQGRGSIVNNLSILTNKVMQTQSHYAASKRAILAVQEHAALEHVKDGIRVNSVSPGFARPSEALEAFLAQVPEIEPKIRTPSIGRILDAVQDIYPSVALLLDDVKGGALNGMDIPVAGGINVDEFSL